MTYSRNALFDRRVLNATYLFTFVLIAALVIMPLAALIYSSFWSGAPRTAGEWTFENWASIASGHLWGVLVRTLSIAVCVSVPAVAVGTLLAIIIHRTDFPFKKTVTVLLSLSFYVPSYVTAMAWILLLSPNGILNGMLKLLPWASDGVSIYSMPGMIWIQILHQIPLAFLLMRGPLNNLDGALEEAARTAGATPLQVLFRVTLPLLAYSLLSAGILILVLSIEDFVISAMIGMPAKVYVLSTQIWMAVQVVPVNYGYAAVIALTLSALTATALLLQRRVSKAGRMTVVSGKGPRQVALRLGKWKWLAFAFCFLVPALTLVLPTLVLIYVSLIKFYVATPWTAAYTLRNYEYLLTNPAVRTAFFNTLIVCGVGAAICVVIAFVSAYFTVRAKPRGASVLDFIVNVPFGIPGIVIGLGLIWAYTSVPIPIYGTLIILIVAFVTRFLPYGTEAISGQLVQIDKSMEEVAWVSGSTRLGSLARIILPLSAPAVQSAYMLLFMIFFRELSSAILLYTSGTQVISILIFGFFESGDWGLASATSFASMVIIFLVMGLIVGLTPDARKAR